MAKNQKLVNIQKKKGNVSAAGESTNGKFKNKTGVILNKKQKNKKPKKAGSDNSPTKSTVLAEKDETIIDANASNGQEVQQANNSSPKKQQKAKKGKTVIVDESVVAEILSNPKIGKKKLKKKMVKAATEPVSPSKLKQKKNATEEKRKEEDGVKGKPTKSDKKRKDSSTKEDQEDKVEMEDEDEVVEDEDEEMNDEDEEVDVSSKKQKLKQTDDETPDEAAKDKTPSISVFVGNLPINTKREKLLKLFSKFGKVKSIRFRLSNGTKFFKSQSKVTAPNVIAFVDYETEEDAKASLVLNGEKIKDNVIRVNMQSKAKSVDSFDGKRTVFVGNLKYSVNDQSLHDLFSCCGEIEYARTMQCDKGCNGIGYVCFKKSESIGMALELNDADLLGRPIRVQRYVKKTPGGPKEKKNKKEKPTGAVRRLGKKQKVKTFGKGKEPNAKKQFAGVKAKEKKKGFVKKNKKPLKGPKLLAKKIASRDKTTKAA